MDSSRIFIKGLPPKITEAELRKHFSAKDRVITDVKLIPNRRIAFIGYKTPLVASRAIKYFNKSYIRMSRIFVEPARPISESSPSKDRNGPDSATNLKNGADTVSNSADPQSKKRKRSEVDESNPRLREFLAVMRPGGEGLLADQGNAGNHSHENEDTQALIPEGESDVEYEPLPTSESKHRKRTTTSPRLAREDDQISKLNISFKGGADDRLERPEDVDHQQPMVNATDEDWLRSRTNRLLDLVDPEDLHSTVKPDGEAEESKTDGTKSDNGGETKHDEAAATAEVEPVAEGADTTVEAIRRTSRLFLRNLPYSTTEEEISEAFERYGAVQEVHLPCSAAGSSKGFAMILFSDPQNAVDAFQAMDRKIFQGRVLHILPGNAKRESGLDEFEIAKLPLKKQNLARKRAEAASNSFNWNALYMSQDAVNASVADRLGVAKAELLDPTSADTAVKQAIAETSVIQETKSYFATNGVDLDAFKSRRRGDTSILVKNFPYGTTIEELRRMFEESGPVLRVLMPPSGTIAIVEFAQAGHAKAAFGRLAYRRIRESVLFLEKGPKDLFTSAVADRGDALVQKRPAAGHQALSVTDLLSHGDKAEQALETSSLFVRNLNFATTSGDLAKAFSSLDGFVSARVKTKTDVKRAGQTLSMGFGFVEFRTREQAQAGLKAMDGHVLDGHTLAVKASHKGLDAAEERRREDKARRAAGQRTKVVIKNLPFQATKRDVRALFGTYGQLRSIRVPKKVDYTSRGFAFADFVTPREAENALNALRDTHLLGRRLVLDYAEADAADAEEQIEKMQRRVGGQVNKVALQQLTGGGRKKVNIGQDEEEDEG